MNAKYYPALRKTAEYAAQVLIQSPEINKAKANKPSDILVPIYNTLSDIAGMEDKDIALEVSKLIFYGYHIEVNTYYNYRAN
jgi:hypothetical protein